MPSAPVVSEADPVLQQSPVLEEFVDDVFSSPASSQTLLSTDDENTPLLKAQSRRDRTKPWYRRASPKLLVPFALASALCRGITLAPRVEVFTQIACDQLRIEPATEFRSASLGAKSIARTEPIFPSIQSPLWSMASSGDHVHIFPTAHVGHNTTRVVSPRKPTCRIDPEVQQGAAKLQMVIMTLTGALSALTSGFWGQFGDRHGRSCVIALSIFAMLATDIVFVLAASQSANPAFSFLTASRILVLSPLVEGALGGFPTMQAALNAYISDATPAGTSRAKIFARFFGIIFVGVAAGPTLGSVLPFDPFRISIVIGMTNLILVLLLLPESLTKEQRDALIASRASAEDRKPEPERGVVGKTIAYITGTLKGAFAPMAILLPKKRTGQGQAVSGKDWSLTYLSISLALYLLTIAIYSVKFLYAEHVFGWNTKELSYYLSFMGTLRALNLIVILPYIIKIYKPKSSKRSSSACSASYTSPAMSPHGSIVVIGSPPTHERTMSLPPVPTPSSPVGSETPQPISATHAQMIKRSVRLAREQQFDLRVARISMFMDFLSYFLLCSSNSATAFVMTTTLSAFGGGTSPAMQSLALGILGHGQAQADVGRLFGALSMLSSIASTILSPMIFGSIYSLTVAVFPKAIFIVATAVLTTALALLALVQPTQPLRKRDLEDFPPRGRSRRSKDLRRTYTG